jgi:hypothetical protein
MHALVDSIEYGLVKQGVTDATGPASEKFRKAGAAAQ